ncbi:MAG TPA: DUF979 domain-containing protein, partial [Gemmatimonadaceae bacterium]|nr:DUF979 domain-containing protein [Gemmatimonadaceae bacterium]
RRGRRRGGVGVITLEFLYLLMGVMVGGVALVNLFTPGDARRYRNALFWGIWGVTFLVGSRLSNLASGCLAIALALVAAFGRVGQVRRDDDSAGRAQREASARRWGNRLFVPALAVPAVTILGTVTLKGLHFNCAPLVDPKQVTLVSLGAATLVALALGMAMLRPPALAPIRESRRLMDSVGWAAVLPQMLAALGALFAAAGVGTVVSRLAGEWIPLDTRFAAVATYTVGMALFTMIMGNAFAAFPVMTAGIGLPLVIHRFGGDPALVAAVGMLSGFCGTLMTPMAANFNIVPAALLELPNEYAVIRVQIPTALVLLATNTALMYLLAFNR